MSKAAKDNTAAGLLTAYQKQWGEAIGCYGGRLINKARIPTGLMALDLALAGGIPRGKATIIYGPESSSKTNIALCCIAQNQRLHPEETNVFVDAEHAYDPEWAARLGVDIGKLIVFTPLYAEQITDIVEGLLYADDTGIVVLDSVANMTTMATVEKDAAQGSYGGNSIAVSNMCRKVVVALADAEHAKRYPTPILINQVRMKVGFVLGDPEDMPGGKNLKHTSSMTIRVHGKNEYDKKISEDLPIIKEVKFGLKKWKVPILAASGRFEQAMLPHKGLLPGQSEDVGLISDYLKEFGLYTKHKQGWEILGEVYKTQADFEQRLRDNHEFGGDIRIEIIKRVISEHPLMGEGIHGEEKKPAA